jgi:YegS/Rv2252/BmrU family lipid kinase
MSDIKRVRFIINPISGGKSKSEIPALAEQILPKTQFNIDYTFTKNTEHTCFLAKECVQQAYDWVIAVGGDGTINQVAAQLIHTPIALGIVPFGSGNGLARALQIPLQSKKAISNLNQSIIQSIDTGLANTTPFVNVCGFGFDAHVSAGFSQMGTRGFKTYAKVSLQTIRKFKSETLHIEINDLHKKEKAFILAICNGPQYGNNAFIAPQAELTDGQFHITHIEEVNWKNILGLGTKLFLKNIHQSPLVKTSIAKQLTIHRAHDNYVNIDGEPIWLEKSVKIKMQPLSLNILIPNSNHE